MNTTSKKQWALSDLDQFNNFCKAMAEQELFEAGVFPEAKDADDVRAELTREDRPSTPKVININEKILDVGDQTVAENPTPVRFIEINPKSGDVENQKKHQKKHKWEELDDFTSESKGSDHRWQEHWIDSSHRLHREQPAASGVDDKGSMKSPPKLSHK